MLVGLDFDGTLSPIVEDPARAEIHADGVETLTALAPHVRAVAVVTGRPARQVVALGRLEDVAEQVPPGRVLVRGQYGLEQWDSDSREFTSPDEPAGLAAFRAELRGCSRRERHGRLRGGEGARRRRAHPPDERPGAAFARLEPGSPTPPNGTA